MGKRYHRATVGNTVPEQLQVDARKTSMYTAISSAASRVVATALHLGVKRDDMYLNRRIFYGVLKVCGDSI